MIRTIFFDYDGVLTTDKSGSLTTYRYLSDVTGLALPTIYAAFAPHQSDLLSGRVRHAHIWPMVCTALNKDLDIRLLSEAFESTPLNADMFSFARKLGVNHSVGIITDNNLDRMHHLRTYQGLDRLFNPIVISAEAGSSKQGTDIFLKAISRAESAPRECIFIDNSESNLVAARALGLHAIFHDDEKNDMDALARAMDELGVRAGLR